MSTIVTRSGKGSPLTTTELDANFTNLNTDKIQSGNTVAALTITAAVVSNDLTVDTNTLKVDSTNNRVGILNASPDVTLDVGTATDSMHVPTGTTAQRPGSPAAGYFRYNSTTGGFEGYTTEWGEIGGGGANLTTNNYTGDGSTVAFTLSINPSVEQNTFVYIDGVYQQKNTYATSGTTLTLSTAPVSGASIEVMSMTATNSVVGTVSDNAITTAKIADDAVTAAKLASSAVVTASIVDDNVTQAKIADDAVGSDQLAGSLTVDVNGGTIDGATIGASSASTVVATQVDITAQGDLRLQDSSGGQYIALQAPATVASNVTLTFPADDGDADQVLSTNGSGVLDWVTSGGAYNDWAIKTSAYTAVNKDQLICNHASTPFTITLPAGSAGNTVIICNAGAALVTVGRNGSQKINSVAADGTVSQGRSTQLVYVDDTIGWFEI